MLIIELMVILGIPFFFIILGAITAISDNYFNRREARAFSPSITFTSQGEVIQPIDEASKFYQKEMFNENSLVPTEISTNQISTFEEVLTSNESNDIVFDSPNINEYELSDMPEELEQNLQLLGKSVNEELERLKESGNLHISSLSDDMKNKLTKLVGERTARLVTDHIGGLQENKLAVIIGQYDPTEKTLTFEGESVKLSTTKEIYSNEDDLILIKGSLLPNGDFRVIHYDDAETVEYGYGVEDFILPKAA